MRTRPGKQGLLCNMLPINNVTRNCYDATSLINDVRVREIVSKEWSTSVNERMSFVDEYYLMRSNGFGKPMSQLLNKIQSPGYKYALRMHLLK